MKGKKLRATLAYPALFEPEPEGGFTVTFPEAGIAATYGPNWDAARAGIWKWESAASMAASPARSNSATWWGWTTFRALPIACRSPDWLRRRPRSREARP